MNHAAIESVDDEALALRQFYFAGDDNVCIRHYPEATTTCLCWQVGVIEPETVQWNGSSFDVERFHLMLFASTKAALIALLDGKDGALPS